MNHFHVTLRSALQVRRRGQPLLLLLDYDGTLVEIAPRPELAQPAPELLELLGRLAARGDMRLMVVSGRPLSDLQGLLPVSSLDFVASHGGEIFIGGRLHPLPLDPAADQELSPWRNLLVARLQNFPGWWIEDKPQGFALHYRQVPEEHAFEFIGILERWRERLRQDGGFQLLAGKKVQKYYRVESVRVRQ
ncbi:MAG: trehalose-phosphatase [Deltaproteobacteria bacterium]|nr:trehalose-phosphatase [Deltaproteobacteria bacterium]